MVEVEIDDGKTKDTVSHDQDINNELGESAKIQSNDENPNEPEGQNTAKAQPSEEKPDEPAGENKEKQDDHEVTLQNTEKHDEPEGTLENKKHPDEPVGKQKKRKLRFLKKKKNVGNGNVGQNKINDVNSKVAQQKGVNFSVPESSSQQKKVEIVKPVGEQQSEENTKEPEGTNSRGKDENNGEVSIGDKNKKQKQKQRTKKEMAKLGAGIKMEKLKQKIGEVSNGKNIEKMKDTPSLHDKGRRPDKSKDKLGGIIFMCSPKTKPDCFRYSVMGVSMNKKDVVLRIKPGLKLFLYDFDLKLLYGVYRATSSGGMKLEPAAFGGAFPVQVKFEVFKDCYPLPESVFKKAIKENYNEKRKFKTELTFEQVKKLTKLFRTVGVSSNTHKRSPAAKREAAEREENTKVHGGFREYQTNPSRARSDRDGPTYVDYGREARPRESYLSEREYQTYGLLGRMRSRSPPRHAASSVVPRLDPESDAHLRYPVSIYRDSVTTVRQEPLLLGRSDSRPYSLEGRRELTSPVRHEPTMLDERRYLAHELQTHQPPALRQNSGLESYQQQYAYPSLDYSSDPYRCAIRRDELVAGPYYSLNGRRVVYLPETDPLRRREPEMAAFASTAPLDYNQGYIHQDAPRHDPLFAPGPYVHQEASRHDPVFAPVSARYSFAGPSAYR